MNEFENVFLSAKKVSSNFLAIEVDMEKAKSLHPLIRVGMVVRGSFEMRPINMLGGVFEQNSLSNVDTFPEIIWHIENQGLAEYPNHLIVSLNGEVGSSLQLDIFDQMQQYNQAPERYILDIVDVSR